RWSAQSRVTEVVASPTGLAVAEQRPLSGPAPSARDGAQAAYSSTERAVYLVGAEPACRSSNEVWRFSLEVGSWSQLAAEGPSLKQVLSVAYDAPRRRLFVLDAPPCDGSRCMARLLSIDATTGTRHVVRAGIATTSDPSMAVLGNGAVVVADADGNNAWHAELIDSKGDFRIARGEGMLVDEAIAIANGVTLPVSVDGEATFVELPASAFHSR
ncbi:MAG TPA: hypothetical protein VFD36_00830, partial [Kofleriaceae bacterium]|nr:hypothetical protein [Kofleriaceae bacterium]